MKIEDPFSPPGDQSDLNKLRRTRRPLPALGRNLFCVCSCSQVCSSLGRGWGWGWGEHQFCCHLGPPSHSTSCLLYWSCRLDERALGPGLEGSELALGACRAWGSSCWLAALLSPGPDSSLFSSFWLLCCSGHSKWTQWNTSFAVLCVPTIRMKEAGCLSKLTDCQDLQETLVLSATMVHCCWLVETST